MEKFYLILIYLIMSMDIYQCLWKFFLRALALYKSLLETSCAPNVALWMMSGLVTIKCYFLPKHWLKIKRVLNVLLVCKVSHGWGMWASYFVLSCLSNPICMCVRNTQECGFMFHFGFWVQIPHGIIINSHFYLFLLYLLGLWEVYGLTFKWFHLVWLKFKGLELHAH